MRSKLFLISQLSLLSSLLLYPPAQRHKARVFKFKLYSSPSSRELRCSTFLTRFTNHECSTTSGTRDTQQNQLVQHIKIGFFLKGPRVESVTAVLKFRRRVDSSQRCHSRALESICCQAEHLSMRRVICYHKCTPKHPFLQACRLMAWPSYFAQCCTAD